MISGLVRAGVRVRAPPLVLLLFVRLAARVVQVRVEGIPEVQPGDDLAQHILRAASRQGVRFEDHDVVVVTQKAVSKAEGRFVNVFTPDS